MTPYVREPHSTPDLAELSEHSVTGYGVAFATEIAFAKDEIRLHRHSGLFLSPHLYDFPHGVSNLDTERFHLLIRICLSFRFLLFHLDMRFPALNCDQ